MGSPPSPTLFRLRNILFFLHCHINESDWPEICFLPWTSIYLGSLPSQWPTAVLKDRLDWFHPKTGELQTNMNEVCLVLNLRCTAKEVIMCRSNAANLCKHLSQVGFENHLLNISKSVWCETEGNPPNFLVLPFYCCWWSFGRWCQFGLK